MVAHRSVVTAVNKFRRLEQFVGVLFHLQAAAEEERAGRDHLARGGRSDRSKSGTATARARLNVLIPCTARGVCFVGARARAVDVGVLPVRWSSCSGRRRSGATCTRSPRRRSFLRPKENNRHPRPASAPRAPSEVSEATASKFRGMVNFQKSEQVAQEPPMEAAVAVEGLCLEAHVKVVSPPPPGGRSWCSSSCRMGKDLWVARSRRERHETWRFSSRTGRASEDGAHRGNEVTLNFKNSR